MGKGKEAGAGRACAGGPVSMSENKSVSRPSAAHAFMGFVPLGCVLRSVHGGMRQRRAGFCGKGEPLRKQAVLMQAGGPYASE